MHTQLATADHAPERIMTMLSRRAALARGLGVLGGVAALGAGTGRGLAGGPEPASPDLPDLPAPEPVELRPGSEKIAILLYPGFTALDAIGPHHVFINMIGAEVHFVAKTMDPVPTDTGFAVVPTRLLDDIAEPQTLVLVPGGTTGTLAAIEDAATLAFVREHGGRADIAGSVCTGSLVLGAAGLLQGYRATSHWLTRDLLRDVGATPSNERFVTDRDRITGGGVTAGIDYALHLVRRWRGDAYAKGVQMFMEYDPTPPFRSGTPDSPDADPAMAQMLVAMHEPFVTHARAVLRKHAGDGR